MSEKQRCGVGKYSLYDFIQLKLKKMIVNWITMTKKSDEHLRSTYGYTGQLFRPY